LKRAALWVWEHFTYVAWGLSIAIEERLSGAHYRAESRLRREENR